MNLILLGAPGAGKGTLASYLIEKMGVPSISTGNILREAIKNNTPLGQSAKEYMDAGKLVPDQLVIDLLKERIAKRDCKSGFILDGFPRTIPQAEALDEIAKIDCALALEVPNEVIEKRMTVVSACAAAQPTTSRQIRRAWLMSAISAATSSLSAAMTRLTSFVIAWRPTTSRPSPSRATTTLRASSRASTAPRASMKLRNLRLRHWVCNYDSH